MQIHILMTTTKKYNKTIIFTEVFQNIVLVELIYCRFIMKVNLRTHWANSVDPVQTALLLKGLHCRLRLLDTNCYCMVKPCC